MSDGTDRLIGEIHGMVKGHARDISEIFKRINTLEKRMVAVGVILGGIVGADKIIDLLLK